MKDQHDGEGELRVDPGYALGQLARALAASAAFITNKPPEDAEGEG